MHEKVSSQNSTNLINANSFISFIKAKYGNLIIAVLNMTLVGLTVIFGFSVTYSNISIFPQLVYLSFSLFLLISFLSIRKIVKKKSNFIRAVSFLLFGAFLLSLIVFTSRYYYIYNTCYGGEMYCYTFFTNLGIISVFSFVCFSVWFIYFYLNWIFYDRYPKKEGTKSKTFNNSFDGEPDIFINERHTNHAITTCSKCGNLITSADQFCPQCGEPNQDSDFIL